MKCSPRSLIHILLCIPLSLAGPIANSRTRHTIRETSNPSNSGSYIVKLKSTTDKEAHLNWLSPYLGNSSEVTHSKWSSSVYHGFGGKFEGEALEALTGCDDVEEIYQDSTMRAYNAVTQINAPWGISRLSLNDTQSDQDPRDLTFPYTFDRSAGENVDIYIVDTGINTAHREFGSRAIWGATFGPYPDVDDNGHGTHCAGTAAGNRFGVSKLSTLIAVKVLGADGGGATSDIISGLNFALSRFQNTTRPSVISMSLGGSKDIPLEDAVRSVIARGMHVVVAAGNDNVDASSESPAAVEEAITVGASTISDERASFSNFGDVVDVFAPGQDVTSAFIGSSTATETLSGTSMATPHIAGLVAYLLALEGDVDPATMSDRIRQLAREGAVSGTPKQTTTGLAGNTL